MDLKQFETIKNKIKDAEIKSAEAKGKMQMITDTWKQEYGISSVAEAEKKLAELKEDIANKLEMRDKLMNELEKMLEGA